VFVEIWGSTGHHRAAEKGYRYPTTVPNAANPSMAACAVGIRSSAVGDDEIATGFAGLSKRSQVARLRPVALAALAQYPIDVRRVRLLLHGHNTTFRVDGADGATYALRVNVGSQSTDANLDGELAWLRALSEDTDLTVPVPQATRDGRLRTRIRCEALDRELNVVVMSWLPGRLLGEPTGASLRALGAATATLHDHAQSWPVPAGVEWPSAADVLVGDEPRIFGDHPLLTPELREVIDAAHADAQRHLDALWRAHPVHPIHADLHPGNVKWYRRRLAVFDFDDVLMGVAPLDFGITAYYLRGADDVPVDALFEGYTGVRSLPAFTDRQFESMLAGRNLLLLNDVLGALNADLTRILPTYAANSAVKLRAYLETGVYRHRVDGVQQIEW
jgi:Ser/Thr protein kinase RdoA (MazF antagonist)